MCEQRNNDYYSLTWNAYIIGKAFFSLWHADLEDPYLEKTVSIHSVPYSRSLSIMLGEVK